MSFWAFWEAMATDCEEGDEKKLRKKLKFIGDGEERVDGRWEVWLISLAAGVATAVVDDKAGRRGSAARKARVVCICLQLELGW